MELKFAHIVLNVTDLKRSRAFYEKVLLGYTVINESDHHVGFSHGVFSLWLADEDMHENRYTGTANDQIVGVHHFAWKVDTLEELENWGKHLREQGIELQKGGITDDDFGGQGIFFKDPDNIRLEIHLG